MKLRGLGLVGSVRRRSASLDGMPRRLPAAARRSAMRGLAATCSLVLLAVTAPGLLLPVPAEAAANNRCFDFRATSGYVTDPAGCTYVTGDSYPVTRSGTTFGWIGGNANTANRSTAVDPRLAGINFAPSTAPKTFQINLYSPGTYYVGVAMGDAGSAQQQQYVEIFDGNVSIASMTSSGGLSAGQYYDLKGNLHTSATAFLKQQTFLPLTFSSTTMKVVIGKSGIGTNHTLAHLDIYPASSDSLRSNNYQLEESSLGNGGLLRSSSANFSLGAAIGDTAIGNSKSANFQTEAGSQTTGDPSLSVIIDNSNASFGSFSPATPAYATATFSVSNYTSYGYSVIILGDPPRYSNHTIAPMGTTSPAASQTGIDQFGINLVKNTDFCGSGCDVGNDPDRGQFGAADAKPTDNYGTANKFRFVSGEAIAQSPKTSGKVTYTISYIVNVGSLTPGGQYQSDQSIVVVGTF